jgi:hypothetical protein
MKLATLVALAATASSAAAFAPIQSSSIKAAPINACVSKDEVLKSPDTTEFGIVWDPLKLSEIGSDETVAWFRHAEIKHGRVAMAAFVGWWAIGAGLRLPGEIAYGLDFASIPSKGLEAWDAVPGWGKAQMLLFAGLIEFHDELFYSKRSTHYLRGGIPGKVRICESMYRLFASLVPFINIPLTPCIRHRPLRTWFLDFSTPLASLRIRAQKPLQKAGTPRSRTDVLL